MLPECRQEEMYAVPKFEIDSQDLKDFKQDLLVTTTSLIF
jgi:hypothetical protein